MTHSWLFTTRQNNITDDKSRTGVYWQHASHALNYYNMHPHGLNIDVAVAAAAAAAADDDDVVIHKRQ